VPKVIVCATGAGFTVKVCGADVVGAYTVLPACEAVMVQLPDVSSASVDVAPLTLTEQTDCVEDAKLTARPEVDVAESVSVLPAVCVAIVGKVIVCVSPSTLKLWGTLAAAYWLLPACEAVILQVPMALSDAWVPETVQTEAVEELKVIGCGEVDVALKLNVEPAIWSGMELKVMICG
jgi:hypothetical protein